MNNITAKAKSVRREFQQLLVKFDPTTDGDQGEGGELPKQPMEVIRHYQNDLDRELDDIHNLFVEINAWIGFDEPKGKSQE